MSLSTESGRFLLLSFTFNVIWSNGIKWLGLFLLLPEIICDFHLFRLSADFYSMTFHIDAYCFQIFFYMHCFASLYVGAQKSVTSIYCNVIMVLPTQDYHIIRTFSITARERERKKCDIVCISELDKYVTFYWYNWKHSTLSNHFQFIFRFLFCLLFFCIENPLMWIGFFFSSFFLYSFIIQA